jgi:hypothetical protein
VQIRHRDWPGNREADNPADERATPILGRQPMQPGQRSNGRSYSEHASGYRSGEEPGLPCSVTKDRTEDGAETCQHPGSEERRYGLQGELLSSRKSRVA